MIKKSAALIVFFGLFLFSSFVHGQDNRIVYPQVSIGPVPQQCDSLDVYPYFGEYSGLLILGPCDIQIELRLGTSAPTMNGMVRFVSLSKANLTQSLDIDIMDGDGTYLSEYLGAYEVNIPARGSSVYRISSRTFQRGVLVIEATESRITNLTTSFFFKPRNRNGTVSDLIAVQPATTPSHYFRAMVLRYQRRG